MRFFSSALWAGLGSAMLLIQASTVTAAETYVFKDLGTLGGDAVASNVSPTGHVVGYSADSGGLTANYRAFVYWNGNMTNLGIVKGSQQSYALAMNSSGNIVGYADMISPTGHHAVRFLPTTNIDMTPSANGVYSYAYDINESGAIVGAWEGVNGNHTLLVDRAFIFADKKFTFPTGLGGNLSFALGVNSANHYVGWASPAGDATQHATLNIGNATTDLGVLPGGNNSIAFAINDAGQIIGLSNLAARQNSHAFLYANGSMTDLGALGGNSSSASDINNNGDIVGNSFLADNATVHPFIYSDGVMTDLTTLTITGMDGYTLRSAAAINDHGQIAGTVLTPGGASHPFLLTPTSEATILSINTPLADAIAFAGTTANITMDVSGSDPQSFAWAKNGVAIAGQINATLTLASLKVGDSGNYSVTASNLVSEVSSTMHLTVSIPPTVTKQPVASVSLLAGKNAKFTIDGDGTSPLAFQWQISTDGGNTWANLTNGSVYAGVFSTTLNVVKAPVELDGDKYRCLINNSSNSPVATNTITLTVGSVPKVTTPPANQSAIQGHDVTFSATVSGHPDPTYQWTKGKTVLVGETNSTLTFTNVQPVAADTYTVKTTNSLGSASAKATLSILVPAAFTTHPANITVKTGKPAKFTVVATGTAKLTYQWEVSTDDGDNWTAIPKATANTYSIAKTTGLMNGYKYRCIANNAAAMPATSNAAMLTVSP